MTRELSSTEELQIRYEITSEQLEKFNAALVIADAQAEALRSVISDLEEEQRELQKLLKATL